MRHAGRQLPVAGLQRGAVTGLQGTLGGRPVLGKAALACGHHVIEGLDVVGPGLEVVAQHQQVTVVLDRFLEIMRGHQCDLVAQCRGAGVERELLQPAGPAAQILLLKNVE